MRRRHFLQLAAGGAAALAASGRLSAWPWDRPLGQRGVPEDDYPFPYDPAYFDAAERVVFLDAQTAAIGVVPKPGQSLDLRLACDEKPLSSGLGGQAAEGVNDSFHFILSSRGGLPDFRYRIEYRAAGDKDGWRATPWRSVKTPLFDLKTRPLQVILIGDDHTYDDADSGDLVVRDPFLREMRLNGDYVNMFVEVLLEEPDYIPGPLSVLRPMMSAFSLASTIAHILTQENPDLILILGDSTGIGAGYKWAGLGLKDPDAGLSEEEYDSICRLFWLRMRKMYSALSPTIPMYLCLGNHDGESGYDAGRAWAKAYRRHFFPQPGLFQGGSPDENYYSLAWGGTRSDTARPLFIILDSESYTAQIPRRPEDWTLGAQQRLWLEQVLQGSESCRKFAMFHHVIGGWPRGTNESITSNAYGRGPLFTEEDYADFCPDPRAVEQVALTQLMATEGVRAIFYGHDHIHHVRRISGTAGSSSRAKMSGICVGSPKPLGERAWYKGELWKRFYGSYGWDYREPAPISDQADFFGPSGYTKLTITPRDMIVEYIRSFFNHPDTNLSPALRKGDLVSATEL